MARTGKRTSVRFRVECTLALTLAAFTSLAQPRARLVADLGGLPQPGRSVQTRTGIAVTLRAELIGPRGEPHAVPPNATVRFFSIESTLHHVAFAPPNPGNPAFSNAVLFGPHHGRWLGYDSLEYTQREVSQRPGTEVFADHIVVRDARPSDPRRDTHGDAGSAWFSAEITLPDGSVVRTPDASSLDRLGLSADVMRVSFRESDSFVGWLSTYFNVPDVFGSNGTDGANHQTDRYVGADCADVLVRALRAAGARGVQYTSVAGIGTYATPISTAFRVDPAAGVTTLARSPRTLRWETDVRVGDLLAIDYADDPRNELPRAWDHIGVLVEDRGPDGRADGVLGPDDVLRHMGVVGLSDAPLREQGPIRAVLWRWRDRVTDRDGVPRPSR